ncbi:hypothetical protein BJX70DRAFT_364807 [Aspergillus crustosus]
MKPKLRSLSCFTSEDPCFPEPPIRAYRQGPCPGLSRSSYGETGHDLPRDFLAPDYLCGAAFCLLTTTLCSSLCSIPSQMWFHQEVDSDSAMLISSS